MTDLRGGFTPEVESDSSNSTIKTVAALIVALMLGVVGAYYYFGPSMTEPATRVALVTPPAVPLKPVIPPQMVTPSPQASAAPMPTTEAKAAATAAPPSAPTHPRRHVQQAEVQPAPAVPAATEPTASPALTAPTPPPLSEAPVQPAADPTQPAQQP
jgi:hypothetical protein